MTSVRKLSSRDALIEAGFTVLHNNPGANLSDVAQAAGVGRATLHRHFASRELLVRELAKIAMAEMDAAVDEACRDSATAADALRDCMAALVPLGDRYGFLMLESLEQDEVIMADFERQQRETEEWVVAATEEGLFDPQVPVDWIVRTYEYLIYTAWDSVRQQELTPAQASALAWRTFTSGVGKPS